MDTITAYLIFLNLVGFLIMGERSYHPLAICQITEVNNTFFEINSIDWPMQGDAFKDISITS